MTTAQERDEKVLKDQLQRIQSKDRRKCNESQEKKSSEEEHRVDAKAPSAEEGRGKLRKAMGSRKQAVIR